MQLNKISVANFTGNPILLYINLNKGFLHKVHRYIVIKTFEI